MAAHLHMEPHDTSFTLRPLADEILLTAIRLHDGTSVTPAHLITREPDLPPLVEQPGRSTGYRFIRMIPVKDSEGYMSAWKVQNPIIHHPTRTEVALYKYHRSFTQLCNDEGDGQWAWCKAVGTFDVPLQDTGESAETQSQHTGTPITVNQDARPPGRPPKKKAKDSFVHRTPLFPPEPSLPWSLHDLPQELLFIKLKGLDLETLVVLGAVSRHLKKFLSDDESLRREIWQPAREAYRLVPLCAPNHIMNPEWGDSVTELQWARWVIGGGNCVYCGQYTRQPRASYALNIHVCFKSECISQWNSEVDERTTVSSDAPVDRPTADIVPIDVAIEQEILAHHEHDKMERGTGMSLIPLYPVAEQIRIVDTLNNYVLSSSTKSDLIRQRAPDEQPFVLYAMLKEEGMHERGIGRQANGLRDSALARLKKKKGLNCKTPYPRLLSQIDAFSWPSDELNMHVSNGLPFVESGPHHEDWSQFGTTIVDWYFWKKYKGTDFKIITQKWQESVDNNTRMELIAIWEERAKLLEPKMQCAEQLMKWRDQRKETRDKIRAVNNTFLRQQIETMKLVWDDAGSSPTLARVKNLSQLAQDALSEESQLWIHNKVAIKAETEQLTKRRLERDGSRPGGSVVDALYRFCEEEGLGPLPPKSIFQTLPTPMLCPATSTELRGTFTQWTPQLVKEVEEWREAAKAALRRRALEGNNIPLHARNDGVVVAGPGTTDALDILDQAASLFCCETCDAAAERRAKASSDQARKAFADGKAKKAPTRDVKPRYDPPMTWKEVLTHRCDNWDLNTIRKHEGAEAIALKACKTLGWNPKATRTQDLVRLGKAWSCENKQCGADLDWRVMVCHFERHDHMTHESHAASGSIPQGFRKRVGFAPSADAVNASTNLGIESFRSPLFDNVKAFQCARCPPHPTAGKERAKFTRTTLKDHLREKHRIHNVQSEDIIFVGDLPIPVPARPVARSLPLRVPGTANPAVPEHRCHCIILKAMP